MERSNCNLCNKSFSKNKNLIRHMRTVHNEKNLSCNLCDFATARSDTLNGHKLKIHKQVSDKVEPKVICPLCQYNCLSRSVMLRHYTSKHDIKIISESLNFPTEKDFYDWKSRMEKSEQSEFKCCRGAYVLADRNCRKLSFTCHRDGMFISKAKTRHQKVLGSNKINGHCPAKIEARIFANNSVDVTFSKTHVGHSTELGRLRLTKRERDEIAKKIAAKIPFDHILDSVRSSINKNDLERRDLLTRKDLHNIARDYKLKAETLLSSNDATNVPSWVQEMKESGNVVLFYKPSGSNSENHPQLDDDDFVLIIMNDAQVEMLRQFGNNCVCLDSTYGLNCPGFEMTTLLVLDNLHQGFPCAFMFSNKINYSMLEIFIATIRNALGFKLQTTVFMSDMAEEFYNSWVIVMDQPKYHLFCSWHVDRAWKRNLDQVNGKEKQTEVYKSIKSLMEEKDIQEFEKRFNETVENLKKDPSTWHFGVYFEKEYRPSAWCWAYCYRQHSGFSTNMHLERMHGVIKHIFLRGKKPKRLDMVIHATMRFLREKIFDRLINLDKSKIISKISTIRNRHEASLKLTSKGMTTEKDGTWNMISSDLEKTYIIKRVNKTACKCELICVDCKFCIHDFICSCTDSSIKFNMCKHIHFIISQFVKEKSIPEEIDYSTFDEIDYGNSEVIDRIDDPLVLMDATDDLHQQGIVKGLPIPNASDDNIKRKKELLLNEFESMMREVNCDEHLDLIEITLRSVRSKIREQNETKVNRRRNDDNVNSNR